MESSLSEPEQLTEIFIEEGVTAKGDRAANSHGSHWCLWEEAAHVLQPQPEPLVKRTSLPNHSLALFKIHH